MEQAEYLIDTNAVIDYLGKKFTVQGMDFMNNVIDALPNVSVITKIEVLGFKTSDSYSQLLESFMNDVTVLDLTAAVVNESIKIRKKYKIKLPDAIIAATAIVYELILVTHNISDFKDIKKLKLVDPFKIQ